MTLWWALPFLVAQLAGSLAGFLLVCSLLPDSFPVPPLLPPLWGGVALLAWGAGVMCARRVPGKMLVGTVLAGMGIVLGTMALGVGYIMVAYARVPVDIVSFAESSFINDLVKWRMGTPIYTPVGDHSAYPYMPGTQFLTWGIASLVGDGTSIPLLRHVALAYVVLAALVASATADRLLAMVGAGGGRPVRILWLWPLACVSWLAATDPRFNMFVHSLHNDGLALLVSMVALMVLTWHLDRPRAWSWVALVVLPVAGYLVKQSLLVWAPLFSGALWVAGRASWRRAAGMLAATAGLAAAATWYGYLNWGGADFRFWIFESLGSMEVSPARSVQNFLSAGGYAAGFGFFGLQAIQRGISRPVMALFLASVGLFLVESYTSGLGFTPNHLGPGVVFGAIWGMVALGRIWPPPEEGKLRLAPALQVATLAAIPVFLLGGMGLYREPRNPIPADLDRYVAAIESEFAGLPTTEVLLDMGTWPYLRAGVVMKDRGDPVALHAGANVEELNPEHFAAMLERIRSRTYRRILVRNIEGEETLYDYQFRGTGIREAILEEYQVVRRIPAVEGVRHWSARFLLDEVTVLEPRIPSRPASP